MAYPVAMNTAMQLHDQDPDFGSFGQVSGKDGAEIYARSIFNFLRNCIRFSIVAAPFMLL